MNEDKRTIRFEERLAVREYVTQSTDEEAAYLILNWLRTPSRNRNISTALQTF
jgi:hypothetical protein